MRRYKAFAFGLALGVGLVVANAAWGIFAPFRTREEDENVLTTEETRVLKAQATTSPGPMAPRDPEAFEES